MTPEQLAMAIELALYRVGDRWRGSDGAMNRLIGNALREVADEVSKVVADRLNPLAHGQAVGDSK